MGRPRKNPDQLTAESKRKTWVSPSGEQVEYSKQTATNITASLYPGDQLLLEYIMSYMGVSKSAAVRAAIGAFAAHLAYISGSRQA